MKIAVVGATGLVGQVILNVLEERNFKISELIPVASEKSIGKTLKFKGNNLIITGIKNAIKQKPSIAIFSAGAKTSLKCAPEFAKNGTTVVDNSSAWRMDKNVPLVVPEINADIITKNDKIIANPNCSTIQMVLALAPLNKIYGIKRLVVSTYQSVSGTGVKAINQLENERKGLSTEKVYPHPIHNNILPHCDDFTENNYTKEEMKLSNETVKILNDYSIRITATAARVPVTSGHSESVNIEFKKEFDIETIINILRNTPGIIVQENPSDNIYPMVLFAEGKNEVFVGRIRKDFSNPNSLNMWIVSDNLRKGAATNAIQIAEYLVKKKLI